MVGAVIGAALMPFAILFVIALISGRGLGMATEFIEIWMIFTFIGFVIGGVLGFVVCCPPGERLKVSAGFGLGVVPGWLDYVIIATPSDRLELSPFLSTGSVAFTILVAIMVWADRKRWWLWLGAALGIILGFGVVAVASWLGWTEH
jgi:hypothetical protein